MPVSLLLVAFASEGELQGKIAMYILQETCPVLRRRIDRVKGKRNLEAGEETLPIELHPSIPPIEFQWYLLWPNLILSRPLWELC